MVVRDQRTRLQRVGETARSAIERLGRRVQRSHDRAREGADTGGHLYGTSLDKDEREALIEYLRTL